jgi:cytochrome c peroxidase
MPKNYHAEYGEFGKKLNSRHIAETFDSINQFRDTFNQIMDFDMVLKLSTLSIVKISDPSQDQLSSSSSQGHASFKKKPLCGRPPIAKRKGFEY